MGEKIDQTQSRPDQAAVEASLAVLDRFMMALNSGDEPALLAALHFPHYRLAGDGIQVWDRPGSYLPRRQLGDRVVSLIVDRHQIWWMLGRGGAVELRGLAANHRLQCISEQTNYLEGLLQMGFSGRTAIVTGAPSGS